MSNDRSHLTKKQITDVNGKQTTVHVNDKKGDGTANAQKLGAVTVPVTKSETADEKQRRVGDDMMKAVTKYVEEKHQGKISIMTDRNDKLNPDQVRALFNPGDEQRDNENEWFSNSARYDVESAAGEFVMMHKDNQEFLDEFGVEREEVDDVGEHDYDAQASLGSEVIYSNTFGGDVLRDSIEQSTDYDGWYKDMLSNSGNEFMGVPLARYSGYINGLSDDAEERKAAWIESNLKEKGFDLTEKDQETIKEIAANGPYDYHEGVTMEVFWNGSVSDLEPLNYGAAQDEREITFQKPNILVMDPMNGSGFEGDLEKPHTMKARVPFFDLDEDETETKSEGKPTVRLDRDRGGYSWDETAGLAPSAFESPEVNVPEKKE